MRRQPLPAEIRGVLAAALLSMLCLNSCDLAGDEGGPGSSPGILGSIPPGPLPTLPSLGNIRASTGFFQEPNGFSYQPSLSEDGRHVAYYSYASNLVPDDTNGQSDIFVRDTQTGVTSRVSVDSAGNQGNNYSSEPFISPTGQYVVFTSSANNLVGVLDTNNQQDVFLHNRDVSNNGFFDEPGDISTIRVSIADDDVTQGNQFSFRGTVSRDGNIVAFASYANNLIGLGVDTNNTYDVFVRNVSGLTTTRISVEVAGGDAVADGTNANSTSFYPGISDDGAFVVFMSYANDLILGDTNGLPDIFRTNVTTLATIRVSIADDDVTQANSSCYTNYFSGGGNSISADGNFITFASPASNLVTLPADTNGNWDVFIRDVSAGTTTLVSRGPMGVQPNDFTFEAKVSADGSTVCFFSYATNMGPDANFFSDAFVKVGNNDPVLMTKHSDGTPGNDYSDVPVMSANGEVVAWASYANNLIDQDINNEYDIFVHDRDPDGNDVLDEPGDILTIRVSEQSAGGNPDGPCDAAFIAAGGPIVVFQSTATNVVTGDLNGATSDIFRRDIASQTTHLVSVNTGGGSANGPSFNPVCSADGRFVAFQSDASDLTSNDFNGALTDIFVRDTVAGLTFLVSVDSSGNPANGPSMNPSISSDGRYVVFESFADNLVGTDNGLFIDIFLHDRVTGTTVRVSTEAPGDPDMTADDDNSNSDSQVARISGDGRFVVYFTDADDIVVGDTNGSLDVFVYDRAAGTNSRVSVTAAGAEVPANFGSGNPSISADGRFVAFLSFSPDLVPGDTNGGAADVFVKDLQTGAIEIVSVDSNENQPMGMAAFPLPRISASGRYVVFETDATGLVAGDADAITDVFLRDRQLGTTVLLSISGVTKGNGHSSGVTITDDGKWACFQTEAINLVTGDATTVLDVVVRGPLN